MFDFSKKVYTQIPDFIIIFFQIQRKPEFFNTDACMKPTFVSQCTNKSILKIDPIIHASLSLSLSQGMNRHPFKRKVKLMIPYKDQSNIKRSGHFRLKTDTTQNYFVQFSLLLRFAISKYHATSRNRTKN